jgi:hypothetical protein
MVFAPICLFTYNRLDETRKTVEALQNNFLAQETDVFIFSDYPKNDTAMNAVTAVRSFIKSVTGFKSVTVIERDKNFGLAKSIITDVSQVINDFGSVIVLEDDLLTSQNFLNFMNDSLNQYKKNEKVWSISGFCLEVKPKGIMDSDYDAFFWGRAHSWGWATWENRWASVDWNIDDWTEFKKDKEQISKFNQHGSDLFNMLKKSMLGKINSWYIRFAYNQFKQSKLTVYPFTSKVINIGFMDSATHCDTYNRNKVIFDSSLNKEFSLPTEFVIDQTIRKQLYKYKSLVHRATGKILTYSMKLGLIKQRTQEGDKWV